MASFKQNRAAEDMKREIYDIMRSLKDPRITGLLSIVKLDLSADYSLARVYISSIEGMEQTKSAVAGLNSAAGYVRREINHRMKLRRSPEIKFIADDSIAQSAEISRILRG
ncbi:MAG: 30S ribosome-binding factor RbfA [Oscillospiraceae bacterium]|nr:30S ribosome-binding factor RbfA [Oscillospiraceae bacterium]MBQ8732078.1 30S ribosome-binding factor RbfA [Oscillospiraceae bacterium]